LKGRKIGGPKGTILHQLLAAYTARAGIRESDYEFINMGLPSAAAALSTGEIDIALLAGADAYRASEDGARTLADGVSLVDATTVIATTDTYLKKNPDVVRRFLAMHDDALSYMESDRAEALRLTADATRLPVEAVEAMYPWYDFSRVIAESDVDELKRTQDFMLENGLQRNRIDIDSIVVKSF
jgi:sulfonate transport system substrate-binding protein